MHRVRTMAMLVSAGAALFASSQAWAQQRENAAREMMLELGGGMKGDALAKAIERAERHPLGSKLNPVRENQPQGQHEYLRRLRCADDQPPAFSRAGNVGEGPYRFIVDLYVVTCAGQAAVEVYIDMYHGGPEDRPVPGFTIVARPGVAPTAADTLLLSAVPER